MVVRLIVVAAVIASGLWLSSHVRSREAPAIESAPAYEPRGVFHTVAGAREHGLASVSDLAARARGIGLSFIVLTDTDSQLAGPMVRDNVLILSYAETATLHGPMIALGAAQPLDDKQKSDPLSAARAANALPVLTRVSEPRRDWWTSETARAGGVEIASVPAVARRLAGYSSFGLVPLILGAQWNQRLAAAQLFKRDRRALEVWDELPGNAVGFCSAGAASAVDPSRDLTNWQIILDAPLPDDAAARPQALLAALTRGAFHNTTALFGDGVAFTFGARSGNAWVAHEGDAVRDGDAEEIVVVGPQVSSGKPHIILFHDGQRVEEVHDRELHYNRLETGSYRAEVRVEIPDMVFGATSVPVVYSNRIQIVAAMPPRGLVTPPGPWSEP